MDSVKSPRFPYFDFKEHPFDPVALRAHFAESLDAVTLCHFSVAGLQVFHHCHRHEQKAQTRHYRLLEHGDRCGWWWTKENDDPLPGNAAAFAGDGMMFGRLHAHVVKLDARIFGPHPVGTTVQLITVDATIQPGRMQYNPGLLHTDGRARHFQAVYDYMDDSGLPTRYITGYAEKADPLAGVVGTVSGLFAEQRIHILSRLVDDKDYLAQIAAAHAAGRFWTAEPNTIVLRATRTPHMGQVAQAPTRRAHAHMVVARPQPL